MLSPVHIILAASIKVASPTLGQQKYHWQGPQTPYTLLLLHTEMYHAQWVTCRHMHAFWCS